MKTIEISNNLVAVEQLLEWASQENVIVRRDGEEYIVAIIDRFEAEVENLRHSDEFIAFLDARLKEAKIPMEEARKILLE